VIGRRRAIVEIRWAKAPARKAVIDVQRYSPFELSLDWTVASEKGPFIGRKALLDERRRGPARRSGDAIAELVSLMLPSDAQRPS